MEIRAQKCIQQEQLSDNIYYEDDLCEDVENDQDVSEMTATDDTACTQKTVFETNGAACPVFSLTSKISTTKK